MQAAGIQARNASLHVRAAAMTRVARCGADVMLFAHVMENFAFLIFRQTQMSEKPDPGQSRRRPQLQREAYGARMLAV